MAAKVNKLLVARSSTLADVPADWIAAPGCAMAVDRPRSAGGKLGKDVLGFGDRCLDDLPGRLGREWIAFDELPADGMPKHTQVEVWLIFRPEKWCLQIKRASRKMCLTP